jgi:hypothetical protein
MRFDPENLLQHHQSPRRIDVVRFKTVQLMTVGGR